MFSFDQSARCFVSDGTPLKLTEAQCAQAAKLSWWYGLPLSGMPVLGPANPLPSLHQYLLGEISWRGKRVLNIGGRDGFFSFLLESLGAHVVEVDDFPKTFSFKQSREFAAQILHSQSEALPLSLEQLSPESFGVFDIVLLFDVISRVDDPLSTLMRAASLAREELLLVSHYLHSANATPLMALYRNYDPPGHIRHRHGPNSMWLVHALGLANFDAVKASLWEDAKHITIHAKRNHARLGARQVPYEEMPDDRGREAETAVLVMSCKKFEQLWEPFFRLFHRYWPDCPYRLYFCTDQGKAPQLGSSAVTTIEIGQDKGWIENCRIALNHIPAPRVLLFQEDFLISGPADTNRIRKMARHAHDYGIGCLRLAACPGPTGEWYAAKSLGTLGPDDEYRLSLQLSLWHKAVLSELMEGMSSPWDLEIQGTFKARLRTEPFLSVWPSDPSPIPYFMTAVEKGVWKDDALALLEREGIPTAHIRKKIY